MTQTWHDKERDRYENYLREHWTAEGNEKRPQIKLKRVNVDYSTDFNVSYTNPNAGLLQSFLAKGCDQ